MVHGGTSEKGTGLQSVISISIIASASRRLLLVLKKTILNVNV
jgi:hypothetical protein